MGKMGKIAAGAAVVGVLGVAILFRMNQSDDVMEAIPDPTVRVEHPVEGTIALQTGLTGTVSAAESVYIIATGSGEVLEVRGTTLPDGFEACKTALEALMTDCLLVAAEQK